MDELHAVVPDAPNGVYKPMKLSALDTIFAGTGTVAVKVTRKNEEHYVELPIQSVDFEEVEALVGPPPRIPRTSLGGGKFAEDPQNPDYQVKLNDRSRRYVMALTCFGLAVDIEDRDGNIVWSADNKTHNLEKAIDALKQMGIVYNQIGTINKAITDLTATAEEKTASD